MKYTKITFLLLVLFVAQKNFAQDVTQHESRSGVYVYQLDNSDYNELEDHKRKRKHYFPEGNADAYFPADSFSTSYIADFGNFFWVKAQGYKVTYHFWSRPDFICNTYTLDEKLILEVTQLNGDWADVKVYDKSKLLAPEYKGKYVFDLKRKFEKDLRIVHNEVDYHFLLKGSCKRDKTEIKPERKQIGENGGGYVAISQPIYRKGDTVKVKAVMVNDDQEPRTEKLRILIKEQNYYYQRDKGLEIEKEVVPYAPGLYELEMAVSDSFKLDKSYQVEFYKGKKLLESNTFYVEDYELKNISWHATQKAIAESGIEYELYAKDANQNFVQGCKAEIKVSHSSAESLKKPFIIVPEKLLDTTIYLANYDKSSFTIPADLFPSALQANYQVNITMRDPSNKVYSRGFSFVYPKKAEDVSSYVRIDVLNDTIHLKGKKGDKGELIAFIHNSRMTAKEVVLPANVRYDHRFTHYELRVGDVVRNTKYQMHDPINWSIRYSHDSIIAKLYNPNKIPVKTTFYKNGEQISGSTDTVFTNVRPDDYFGLVATYIYCGEDKKQERYIKLDGSQLNVAIHAPEKIYPGQEKDISIKVTDNYGIPISGSDLTVLSVTNRFDKENIPQLPSLDEGVDGKRLITSSSIHKVSLGEYTTDEYEKWYAPLRLDTVQYYKFLESDQQLQQFSTKSEDGHTYLAVMVVRKGKVHRPMYITKGGEVVWVRTNLKDDLNTRVDARKETVEIRLSRELVTIPNVEIKKSAQNFMVLNLDAHDTLIARHLRRKKLNKDENSVLDKVTARIRLDGNWNETYTVTDGYYRYEGIRANQMVTVGPLRNHFLKVTNESTGQEVAPIFFREGFKYIHTRHMGWDIQKDDFWEKTKVEDITPDDYPFKMVEKPVMDSVIQSPSFLNHALQYDAPREGAITVRHLIESNDIEQYMILVRDTSDSTYQVLQNTWSRMGEGIYDFVYLGTQKDSIKLISNVPVKRDSITYLNPDDQEWMKKSQTIKDFLASYYNPLKFQKPIQVNHSLRFFDDEYRLVLNGIDSNQYLLGHIENTKTGKVLQGYSVINSLYEAEVLHLDKTGRFIVPIGNMNLKFHFSNSEEIVVSFQLRQNEGGVYGFKVEEYEGRQDQYYWSNGQANVIVNGSVNRSVIVKEKQKHSMKFDIGAKSKKMVASRLMEKAQVIEEDAEYAIEESVSYDMAMSVAAPMEKPETDSISAPQNQIRDNFVDNAIWQTRLTTNSEGEATFNTTFPDDITSWETYAMAWDFDGYTGQGYTSIKSFKPLMASLHTPRFVIPGDSASAIGMIKDNRDDRSSSFTSSFLYNGQSITSQDTLPFQDKLNFVAPQQDSVSIQFTVNEGGYSDAEVRKVPVYKRGLEESKGEFIVVEKDTSFTIDLAQYEGEVHIGVDGNVLETLAKDIEYVIYYPYECNEQTASRLLAYLAKKEIKKAADKPFRDDREIRKLVQKLESNRNNSGLWGWWKGMIDQPGMSVHVLYALGMAQKAGFKIDEESFTESIQKLKFALKVGDAYRGLHVYRMLAEISPEHVDPKDIKDLELSFEVNKIEPSQFQELQLMRLHQVVNGEFNEKAFFEMCDTSLFGNMYWSSNAELELFENTILNTIVAYRIMRTAGKYNDEMKSVRRFLVERRDLKGWRNTYTTAKVIAAVISDFRNEDGHVKSKVWVNGEQIEEFPHAQTFQTEGEMEVKSKGTAPIYFSVYQNYWNADPVEKQGKLRIQTHFEKGGERVDTLKAGEKVVLVAEVSADHPVEYVQIDLPIPAGCSYDDKQQLWGDNHIEYYREKASVYAGYLSGGKRTYRIELVPRYSGKYTINPAEIQLMYFPIFSGNTAIKSVKIED